MSSEQSKQIIRLEQLPDEEKFSSAVDKHRTNWHPSSKISAISVALGSSNMDEDQDSSLQAWAARADMVGSYLAALVSGCRVAVNLEEDVQPSHSDDGFGTWSRDVSERTLSNPTRTSDGKDSPDLDLAWCHHQLLCQFSTLFCARKCRSTIHLIEDTNLRRICTAALRLEM